MEGLEAPFSHDAAVSRFTTDHTGLCTTCTTCTSRLHASSLDVVIPLP
jgi:hypothetical protein